MRENASKTKDRRTRYTRNAIKESFLALLSQKPYAKISVTEICKRSEINRGTFYLHYYDVDDVLNDVLEDALSDTTGALVHVLCPSKNTGVVFQTPPARYSCPSKETCTYPLCQKVQETTAYRPLFMDETISGKLIEKMSASCKESYITYLMQHSQLTFEQAEAIFYFQINGCLTVNRLMLKNHCMDWRKIQGAIDAFLKAGLEHFLQEAESLQERPAVLDSGPQAIE